MPSVDVPPLRPANDAASRVALSLASVATFSAVAAAAVFASNAC